MSLLFVAWSILGFGVCPPHKVCSSSNNAMSGASATITFTLNLTSAHQASMSIEPVGDLEGVYRLATNALSVGVSDGGMLEVDYLVVDPFNVLNSERLEVAMGYGIPTTIKVPNELVIASVWPKDLREETVIAAFHRSYGDGLLLATNLNK